MLLNATRDVLALANVRLPFSIFQNVDAFVVCQGPRIALGLVVPCSPTSMADIVLHTRLGIASVGVVARTATAVADLHVIFHLSSVVTFILPMAFSSTLEAFLITNTLHVGIAYDRK